MLRNSIRFAACLVVLAAGPGADAQLTTERGASILVFPKVIADGAADTVVQLVNLSDNGVDVDCTYLDGASAGWQALAFSVALGAQRPLHWTAARGRTAAAGEDPVDIPAAPPSFRGELLCVQVDGTGAPFGGNGLAGQATVADLASGDVAAYTAVGLRGSGLNDGDDVLCIGGEPSDNCLVGAEYDACPAEWILSLPADGAPDPQLGAGASLATHLAVAPCSQNLRDAMPGAVDIEISVFNEMAEQFTGRASVTRWADLSLADVGAQIFTRGVLGTDFAEARLRPAAGSGGFMLVAETTRATGGSSPAASSVGINLHPSGSGGPSDLIVLPASRTP